MLVCHVWGGSSFGSCSFCAALSCVLVGAAGVVGGTFEAAGGGVCWIEAELSWDAAGADAEGFSWGVSFIFKSAVFEQEKFRQVNSARVL